ncbi:MAG TPA: hypothetical protein ENG71_02690 [Thermoplasmatales archaeon]|nr:hypothetical protein [Thermoplasmatales archaeon]
MKEILTFIVVISLLSFFLGGTFSFFDDREENCGKISAGVIDLEINNQNPLNGAIMLKNVSSSHVYYANVTLHLTKDSNPSIIKMRFLNVSNGNCSSKGIVHVYGQSEEEGIINITRSDNSTVKYKYEAKETCIKFGDADIQLGEDETVGLKDTFVITFYGGGLPIYGKIKTGVDDGTSFVINSMQTIGIYYYGILTYNISLVSVSGSIFVFEVESVEKQQRTALSHITFCFSPASYDCEYSECVEIGISIMNSSGGEFVLLDLSEHKTLCELEGEWINLTAQFTFSPCIIYILGLSFYINYSCDFGNATFDIEFVAQQKNCRGFSDFELSKNNFISGDKNG